jgi:hypothetical protein
MPDAFEILAAKKLEKFTKNAAKSVKPKAWRLVRKGAFFTKQLPADERLSGQSLKSSFGQDDMVIWNMTFNSRSRTNRISILRTS